MKKYFSQYIDELEKALDKGEFTDIEAFRSSVLTKIAFMQHERLIHFLVTMLFALILFICVGIYLLTEQIYVLPMILLVLALTIPYISHYYFLENGVQKLYRLYDRFCEIAEKRENEK